MKTQSAKSATLFFLACWVGAVAGLLLDQPVIQMIFASPVVLVLPGLLIAYLMNAYPPRLERWSLIVSLSLGVLIACVLGASLTPAGITGSTTLGLLAAVTLVLSAAAALVAWRRSPRTGPAQRHMSALSSPGPTTAGRARHAVIAWSVSGVVVAAAIAGAIVLSTVSESASAAPDFTQLSVTQQAPDVYQVEVDNLEGVPTQYQLQIVHTGESRAVQSFTLQPQEAFDKEIVIRQLGHTDGQIVATLYGGSPTPLGYRQVQVSIPKQPTTPPPAYLPAMK